MSATKRKRYCLPADPERMNNDRAKWARAALEAFMFETNQVDKGEALRDLIPDLLHLNDRLGRKRNKGDLLELAAICYEEETSA